MAAILTTGCRSTKSIQKESSKTTIAQTADSSRSYALTETVYTEPLSDTTIDIDSVPEGHTLFVQNGLDIIAITAKPKGKRSIRVIKPGKTTVKHIKSESRFISATKKDSTASLMSSEKTKSSPSDCRFWIIALLAIVLTAIIKRKIIKVFL